MRESNPALAMQLQVCFWFFFLARDACVELQPFRCRTFGKTHQHGIWTYRATCLCLVCAPKRMLITLLADVLLLIRSRDAYSQCSVLPDTLYSFVRSCATRILARYHPESSTLRYRRHPRLGVMQAKESPYPPRYKRLKRPSKT